MIDQDTGIVQTLAPVAIVQDVEVRVMEPEGAGIEVLFAEQVAVEPPPEPAHVQLHGPVPDTEDAVPVVQRLVVGAEVKDPPCDDPQEPLIGVGVVTQVLPFQVVPEVQDAVAFLVSRVREPSRRVKVLDP